MAKLSLRSLGGLIPPLVIFVIVMGSIYFGIATPTESAALGVVTALVFAAIERKLSFAMLHTAFQHTAQLTGMILLIIVGAFVLNLTLSLLGVAQLMTQWVVSFDLSLTARDAGLKSYAIDAFVWHKYKDSDAHLVARREDSPKITQRWSDEFMAEFRPSADYVERKWKKYLPFQTTSWNWESA